MCSKREWNKAVKKLKEIAGSTPSSLDYSEWITGACAPGSGYHAYIENRGIQRGSTAMEAVEKLIK